MAAEKFSDSPRLKTARDLLKPRKATRRALAPTQTTVVEKVVPINNEKLCTILPKDPAVFAKKCSFLDSKLLKF